MQTNTNSLFRPYSFKLLGVYSLKTLEYLLELMYPFAIGLAINGLLVGRVIDSLLPLTLLWLGQVTIGLAYQLISARFFAGMYYTLAEKVSLVGMNVQPKQEEIASTSKMNARIDMVEKVCEALADVVPLILNGFIGVLGSMIFLFFYDTRAGLVALGLVGSISLIQLRFGRKAFSINSDLNNQRESQVYLIQQRKKKAIARHLKTIGHLTVKFKDLQARTWTGADIFSLGAVLSVLYIITPDSVSNPGSIYAAVTYIITITDSLELAPTLVDELTHLFDVSDRIRQELRSSDGSNH